MKISTSTAMLCFITSIIATNVNADVPPALLSAFDSTHVQPIENADKARGSNFRLTAGGLVKMASFCRTARVARTNMCTGKQRTFRRSDGKLIISAQFEDDRTGNLRWKKH